MTRTSIVIAVLATLGAVALAKTLFVLGGLLMWAAAIVLIVGCLAKVSK